MGTILENGTYVPAQKENFLQLLDPALRDLDAAKGSAIYFGAPDIGGSPDNAGAANDAAIVALAAAIGVNGSCTVFFAGRAAVYSFDSPITWTIKGTKFEGFAATSNGVGSTVFHYTGAAGLQPYFFEVIDDHVAHAGFTGANFQLEGIAFDGNGLATKICAQEASNAIWKHFSIQGFAADQGFGMYAGGGSDRSNFSDFSIQGGNAGRSIGFGAYGADLEIGGTWRIVGCSRFNLDAQGGGCQIGGTWHTTCGSGIAGTTHAAISSTSSTSFDVDEVSAPQPVPFQAIIDSEFIWITARTLVSGTRYTWTTGAGNVSANGRGDAGSTAATHASGAIVAVRPTGNIRLGCPHGVLGGTFYMDTCQGGWPLLIERDASLSGGLNDLVIKGCLIYDVNIRQTISSPIHINASVNNVDNLNISGFTFEGTSAFPWQYMLTHEGAPTMVRFQNNQGIFVGTLGFYDAVPDLPGGNMYELTRGGTVVVDSRPVANPPPFTQDGVLSVGLGTKPWYNDTGRTIYLQYVRLYAGTSPTGAALIVDLLLDGTTTMFTGTKPTVAAAGHTSKTPPDAGSTIAIPDGHFIVPSITQVGSTIPGSDLTMQVGIAG